MQNEFSKYSDEEAHRVAHLIAGFIRGTLSKKEQEELDDWINAGDENMQLFERLTDEKNVEEATRWLGNIDTEAALAKAKESIGFTKKPQRKKAWIRALRFFEAACIVFILVLVFFNPFTKKKNVPGRVNSFTADISPGEQHATLTLENGSTIVLSKSSKDTSINNQLQVLQQQGEIVYSNHATNAPMAYHTLTIPRKGQYKLVLPDGTQVWLNAESSIRYPTAFEGSERKVVITGEAYFEVAKVTSPVPTSRDTPSKGGQSSPAATSRDTPPRGGHVPFIVEANGVRVEVLGTHFNVNAYSNEPYISVTLAEGSVLVSNGKAENILKPGQQAKISATDFTIDAVETDNIIAWKDNRFNFVNAPLEEIMRQVERWYDAEVIYETRSADHFNALDVPRDVPVSKLLHALEQTKRVHFKIEDNKIIVMK